MSTNLNVESMYYTVGVLFETPVEYTTRNFGQGRNFSTFIPLSDEEHDKVQQHLRKALDTTPRVVSAELIQIPRQTSGVHSTKDVQFL